MRANRSMAFAASGHLAPPGRIELLQKIPDSGVAADGVAERAVCHRGVLVDVAINETSPPAAFLHYRRGAPQSKPRLIRAAQPLILAENAHTLTCVHAGLASESRHRREAGGLAARWLPSSRVPVASVQLCRGFR